MKNLISILIVGLSIIITPLTYSQGVTDYNKCFNTANNLYSQSKYQEALDSFLEGIAMDSYIQAVEAMKQPSFYIYNAACAAALSDNKEKAFELLFMRLKLDKSWYLRDIKEKKDLNTLHSDTRWNTLIDSLTIREVNYESQFDLVLRGKLKKIFNDDQGIRHTYMDAVKKKSDKVVVDSLIKCMIAIDSINQLKLDTLLSEHGWLSKDIVGDVVMTQFLVLQHAPLKIKSKHIDKIEQAAKSGDLPPSTYALFLDRNLIERGEKQRFGTQISKDKDGNPYVAPCENPEKVDSLRASIGLGTMEIYLLEWNLKWEY